MEGKIRNADGRGGSVTHSHSDLRARSPEAWPAKGGRHHHFQARPRRSYYDDPKRLNFRVRMGSGALLLVWSRSLVSGRIVHTFEIEINANVDPSTLRHTINSDIQQLQPHTAHMTPHKSSIRTQCPLPSALYPQHTSNSTHDTT